MVTNLRTASEQTCLEWKLSVDKLSTLSLSVKGLWYVQDAGSSLRECYDIDKHPPYIIFSMSSCKVNSGTTHDGVVLYLWHKYQVEAGWWRFLAINKTIQQNSFTKSIPSDNGAWHSANSGCIIVKSLS